MKKFLISGAIICTFILYSLLTKLSHLELDDQAKSKDFPSNNLQDVDTLTQSFSPIPKLIDQNKTGNMNNSMKMMGQYKDGEYTGPAADAFYGFIQVKAIIKNGDLADVIFLQYPNDRSTSRFINQQAMPILKQEAIAAQSGQVNIVTGATDSSKAFIQSLTKALLQAQ